MTRDYARRIAIGELVRAIGLALGTTSEDVQKFALLLLSRIAALAKEEGKPDVIPSGEIKFWLDMFEQVREKESIQ